MLRVVPDISMADLGKLSDDVLQEVLLLSCSLEDLHATILSSRLFFKPFSHRRKLIIGQVFRQQVTNANLTPQAAIEQADNVVKMLSKHNRGDAVIVYEALDHLVSNDAPSELFLKWALKLYRWYERVEHDAGDRPLVLLEHVHQSLLSIPPKFSPSAVNAVHAIREQSTEKRRRTKNHHLGRVAQDLCHHLVKKYIARNRLGDALVVQKSVHQRLVLTKPDSSQWGAEVVTSLRTLRQFNEALEYEMGVYQISKAGTNPSISLEWARHLITEYTIAGQTQNALNFQQVVLADLMPGTSEYVAWARQLIRMQKRAGLMREALTTKVDVWQRLSWKDPCYFGWARELANDFRRMHQPNEAVSIMESLYRETKRQLTRRPNDGWLKYHANHATRALVREYESCGRFESATEVQNTAC